MTNQHPITITITLEEILQLVSVEKDVNGQWCIKSVYGDVKGSIYGDVKCNVICSVFGNVGISVGGTIDGKKWQSIEETPNEKLKRLIEATGNDDLIEAFKELEDN